MEEAITNIKDLPLPDRPREKLIRDGAAAVSNADLIAILLGSGSKTTPLMSICRDLVLAIDNNPADLSGMSIEQLSGIKGIGRVKAISLIAAMELGKRGASAATPLLLKDERAIEKLIRSYINDRGEVQYHLVIMNHRNELLATSKLVTEHGKLPQLTPVIKLCLEAGAAVMMICRNEVKLSTQFLNTEKAFVIQLDAAASMLEIKMRGLLIIKKEPVSIIDH